MSPNSNLTPTDVREEIIEYPVTQMHGQPSVGNLSNLPLSATLLISLGVMAVTLISYIAIKAGGSVNIKFGENSFGAHGSRAVPRSLQNNCDDYEVHQSTVNALEKDDEESPTS